MVSAPDEFGHDRYLAARRACGADQAKDKDRKWWYSEPLSLRRLRITEMERLVADRPETDLVAW